jgi:diaminopropionate ammonia-lyase
MFAYAENKRARRIGKPYSSGLTAEIAKDVRRFHQGMEGYRTTPLISLKQLANQLNVRDILVKDESRVLDLDSFKVLGASYAIFKVLCKILNLNEKTATFADLKKVPKGKYTFVAATDGNFGKAVAWVGQQLRQKAIVYVPQNMIMRRRVAIQDFGAIVKEPDGEDKSYDGAVGSLAAYLGKDHYVVISDTAWKGFEDVPLYVMQGYLTLCDEVSEQLVSLGIEKPSHTFLQVGVGGFAASVIGYYCSLFGNNRPISTSVEPNAAACFLESIKNDKFTKIKTEDTVMAGLCCGEPSTLAWPVLYNNADYFVSISDDAASLAVKRLATPIPPDQAIVSGESGAAGLGALIHILNTNPNLGEKMGIDKNSTIILFNTEGATGIM